MAEDSTGKPIYVGDKVRFRGQRYLIEAIEENGRGAYGTAEIFFVGGQDINEVACEITVDLVS